ncbi:hypothetical protein [Planococcus ruber]|uniref:hypothetical protein n=1 Tax=Planococcus ruber TaxID=2027871 RepID=UPI001FED77E8|nr:hypothetical protein [Planococcus ruber]MCJ1907729.1 hypothetical protein [Planococcus ruber]
MKRLAIGLMLLICLAGCIGENYDFTPPGITLSGSAPVEWDELAEADVDWLGPENKRIDTEVEDFLAFADEQPEMRFVAGEMVDLLFEHGDFDFQSLSVRLWHGGEETAVEVEDLAFTLPDTTGDYLIEVNLLTDRGSAQYAGKLSVYD